MARFTRIAAALAAGAALSLTSCSFSFSTNPELAEKELEKQSAEALAEVLGIDAADIEMDCPGPIPAEEGETIRCVFINPSGVRIGSTITITSVDEETDRAQLDIQNDNRPLADGEQP